VLAKYTRYVPNYSIAQEDVIPLVFETYGGYAPITFEFLRRITSTIANNDAPRAASLMWPLRERYFLFFLISFKFYIHTQTGEGPSNIGYAELQKLAKQKPSFLQQLTRLLNDFINGKLPRDSDAVAKLKAARGVAIEKANGKPRLIGVRETITNLA